MTTFYALLVAWLVPVLVLGLILGPEYGFYRVIIGMCWWPLLLVRAIIANIMGWRD